MLILVFSDSHGTVSPMKKLIRERKPGMVLHLGDYASDARDLQAEFPGLDIRYVRGNCDFGDESPEELELCVEGVPIFMTHGHRYSVKYTYDSFANAVYFSGAKLGLFGHTHMSEYRDMGGFALMNPGSCGKGKRSYAELNVEDGRFQCRILPIE